MSEDKVIFLDRDGTIINDKEGYLHKIEDLEFLPGSIAALKKLKSAGYSLFLIFGQSGIGRKKYKEEDSEKFLEHFLNNLKKENIEFTAVDYCKHRPEDNCNCRKPKTGMVKKIVKKYDYNPKNCWNIGDKAVDIKMGMTMGFKNILVLTGKAGKDTKNNVKPNFIAKDLNEAAELILKQDQDSEIFLKA